MASRLGDLYKSKIKNELKEKFNYKNINEVPKLTKIVVSSMTRDAVSNGKVVDSIKEDLEAITGQKAVVNRAKKSIASFKLREGQAVGASVTLRGDRMFEFLDRLVNLALPRVRDFRGINSKSFDGHGNYAMGLKEQIIFNEINYDKIDKIRGLGIVMTTTARNNEEGRELLRSFGMPFKK